MKPSQEQAKRLARLDASRKRHGITLQAIADEASKTSRRGSVGVPTVSKVLSGDTKSANVVGALRRLIALKIEEAKARQGSGFRGNGQPQAALAPISG